jgi:membrane fusion protein (multidrug efflux system)
MIPTDFEGVDMRRFKQISIAILGIVIIVGVLGGIKGLQIGRMIAQGKEFAPPPLTITTTAVETQEWETLLTSVGSLEAVQGVMVAAELDGKVIDIAFEPGAMVKAGQVLVKQDTSSERAQLRSSEATAELAKINLDRMSKLLANNTISQSEYDNAAAQYKQAVAQVDNIRAVIAKKTIRAPFAGRLGIRLVNLGQILNGGDPIVSLQSIDPIYANFLLPQQQLADIRPGYSVRITTNALAEQTITGTISAINPEVDAATRNVKIQATLTNPNERLRPGMYVNVAVVLPAKRSVLTIPVTAVLHAPYGDSVFVVESQDGDGPSGALALRQQFVELGEKRGDFFTVQSGLTSGQTLVSTGVFKLRNGMPVVVDNTLAPEFKLTPRPDNA